MVLCIMVVVVENTEYTYTIGLIECSTKVSMVSQDKYKLLNIVQWNLICILKTKLELL